MSKPPQHPPSGDSSQLPPVPGLPKSMRAWQVTAWGTVPSTSLTFAAAHPMPLPPSGSDLLVRISHACLNPVDLALMSLIPASLPFRRRPIPGLDFVGAVAQVGPDAPTHLAVGATVCGALAVRDVFFGAGTLAEYVVVPAERVAVVPEVMSRGGREAEAAGLGVAGQTVVEMMKAAELGSSCAGKRVLVIGASGGVGSLLVQILQTRCAVVVGVCSGRNAEFVKRLGVDEVVDYTSHDPTHKFLAEKYGANPFDVIFDCVGSDALFDHSPAYLKPEGLFLTIVGGKTQGIVPFLRNRIWPTVLGGIPRRYKLLGVSPCGSLQRQAVELMDDGAIKEVPIDSVFELEDAVKGFERLASKRARGKIVIKIAS